MPGTTSVRSTLSPNRVLMSPWLSQVSIWCFVIGSHCLIRCFLDNIMKEVVPAETDDEEMFSVFNVGTASAVVASVVAYVVAGVMVGVGLRE